MIVDLSETGLLETSQIAVLVAASALLLVTAWKTRRAGAPVLALIGLVLGVAALREYSPGASHGWHAYLESHAARWHLVAILAAPLALISIRDRQFGFWAHLRAVAAIGAAILLALGLIGLGAVLENWGDTMLETAPLRASLILTEEVLELVAYIVTLLAAIAAFHRARRDIRGG